MISSKVEKNTNSAKWKKMHDIRELTSQVECHVEEGMTQDQL